jgi:hypothetical protein
MYEHRSQPLLSRRQYIRRVVWHGLFALAVTLASLLLGVLGYRLTEGMTWLDSLLNASMILGGMGPVNPLVTAGGKLFASFYALFSGVVFLITVGVILAPVIHRFLHRFHLDN